MFFPTLWYHSALWNRDTFLSTIAYSLAGLEDPCGIILPGLYYIVLVVVHFVGMLKLASWRDP